MTAAELSAALAAGRRSSGGRGRRAGTAPTPRARSPLRDWVAVHCDVADRPADADPDDDLAWFATQEIPDLL